MSIESKVAIITGASGGIGAALVRVSSWPDVVVEFGPQASGKGPKIHFMVREPSGVRLEFAFDPRLESARKAG